jgi:hypothetical protein
MRRTVALAVFALSSSAFAQCDPSTLFPQNNPTFVAGDGSRSVAIGDLDGDGVPDLAVSNIFSDDVSVLIGNGDGTFQTQLRFGAGDGPQSVAIGDLDGDGVPDLAVANGNSTDVSVLLNQCVSPPPLITSQPNGVVATPSQTAQFSIDADSASVLTYQWRRNGQPLSDNGRIIGTTTDILAISNVRLDDVAMYDVVVTNDEGNTISNAVVLGIIPCRGDTDESGTVDFGDLVSTLFLFGPCD